MIKTAPCIAALVIFCQTALFAETLTFSAAQSHPAETKSIKQVMTEAYSQIGETFDLLILPNKRALHTASTGRVDGALFRKKHGIEENYPDLKKVPVCIHTAELVAYTKSKKISIQGWESLSSYSVDYERGFRAIGDQLPPDAQPHQQTSIIQAFKRLNIGRTDVVIDTRTHGLAIIEQLKLKDIQVQESVLMKLESFHYLHVKNLHLLEPLTHSLQAMQQKGIIDKIHNENGVQ